MPLNYGISEEVEELMRINIWTIEEVINRVKWFPAVICF